MGSSSDNPQRLRPVAFHLKSDPTGPRQYGLIAQEVAKVYPELVTRNEAGMVEGVRYDELAPMLLNEMQHPEVAHSKREAQLERRLLAQEQQLKQLSQQLVAMRSTVASRKVVSRAVNGGEKMVAKLDSP